MHLKSWNNINWMNDWKMRNTLVKEVIFSAGPKSATVCYAFWTFLNIVIEFVATDIAISFKEACAVPRISFFF